MLEACFENVIQPVGQGNQQENYAFNENGPNFCTIKLSTLPSVKHWLYLAPGMGKAWATSPRGDGDWWL